MWCQFGSASLNPSHFTSDISSLSRRPGDLMGNSFTPGSLARIFNPCIVECRSADLLGMERQMPGHLSGQLMKRGIWHVPGPPSHSAFTSPARFAFQRRSTQDANGRRQPSTSAAGSLFRQGRRIITCQHHRPTLPLVHENVPAIRRAHCSPCPKPKARQPMQYPRSIQDTEPP